MQRYYLIVQSICIVEKVFVWAQKKQEVFLFLLDFKVLNWYVKEFVNLLCSNYLSVNLNV